MKKTLIKVAAMTLLFLIMSCKQEQQSNGPKYGDASLLPQKIPIYHFAVHPLHNPRKLIEAYQPLIDYLNSKVIGARFSLEASSDYGNFEKKYLDRKPEFLLPNPWQTLEAIKVGYKVIAMSGEPKDFKGIFIVRKNSDIKDPSDLKGKAVSYPASTALAACIMPQYFLYTHGIDVNKDIENHYVGSQESSIMNVYLKKTVVGATWPPPWRAFQKDHPKESNDLKILWETEPLINNSVMIRDDIPREIREEVQTNLVDLNKTHQGKLILENMETARFILATDKDYNVVRSYVERFEKKVRKVETK